MDKFELFSLTHWTALAGIAGATWLLVAAGRRAGSRTGLERGAAWANLALWTAAHAWWVLPPQLDPAQTLPLQLCHISGVVASLVLLTGHRPLRVLLYFWGFALSTQALLTPTLVEGPASIWFWAFWMQHGFVIAAAVYDVAVLGFRPTWRGWWFACRMTFLYGLAMLPVNLALGANYGFVGNSRPETPSIIDLIGPWPERLAAIALLVAAGMALLMLPWEIARRRRAVR